jgi:hypothetical protein
MKNKKGTKMSYKGYMVTVNTDGTKEWFLNGKRHREDGPACEYASGNKFWYLNGKEYSEKEFKKKTSPVKEYTVADLEKLLGHPVKIVRG